MVVARGPRGDQLKRGVHVEECHIDPGRKVDAENFRIGMDLFCSGEKTQIVFGERGLEVFLFQLLRDKLLCSLLLKLFQPFFLL